jgi:3-methyladenine DNA glycosylase AlkC
MAVRDEVIGELDTALDWLQVWVTDIDENIRRFASELTRPKGVWCAPIKALQAEPQRALHLLEVLRADPSRYVQNSVANWLNDASKTQGPWVESVCMRWERESPCDETRYIVRRARRTMDKA